MEINKAAISIAMALLALPLCYGAMSYKSPDSLERKLASQAPDYSPIKRTMKLSSTATLEIATQDTIATGSDFTLNANLNFARSLPRLRYKWDVPRGLKAISSTEGFIEAGVANPTLTLSLHHTSNKNQLVRLRIFSTDAKPRLIAVGNYDTFDQARVKSEALALKERQDKYVSENPLPSRDN